MLQPIREYMCFGMRRNISDPVFVHVVAFFVWHMLRSSQFGLFDSVVLLWSLVS